MADLLIEALRHGTIAEVRRVVAEDPPAARRPQAIVEAGRLGFQAALALFARKGAHFNTLWRGYRALHSLIQEPSGGPVPPQRVECLEWLLQNGADPELTGGWPPMRAIVAAGMAGEPAFVDRLRNSARMDGFAAAALGDVSGVRQAVTARPEFARERDVGFLTALQCAAGSRMPGGDPVGVVGVLIGAGADVGARTKSWDEEVEATAFAVSAENEGVFTLLLESGADPHWALSRAAWKGNEPFCEIAMAHGAIPDRAMAGGQPLVNNLVRWGRVDSALWLLARGASPNIADDRGWTAVHQAASRGNERMMRAVLAAGGDPKLLDRSGTTPAGIAEIMRKPTMKALLATP